ncbi:hypothetical protein GOBAR_AA01033 [Gossypium barbadense]|uniref:C2H2-type domain-containing protein n=1 Tax=Gossypium barbadense TaxID=3634 RepID=A0A2P5YVE6_GOSBA|nr:hypothetical protein GOBAR_AA01033 [Gossypium barbadense]
MVAYANQHSFSHVPKAVREQRRERKLLNQLENKGVIKSIDPYVCKVCGRRFYTNEKLVNHFKQIHEREHQKRVNQIESARGSRRVKLVGKYSMKMEKYKNAAREVLTPKVGFYTNEKLVNHFKQIHEREHQKRVNQIESARGSRRVKLVGKYSMKMEKYKNAAREVLTPKVGYGLADELKRAGFWVGTVSNRPQAADFALRDHIVDVMDKRKAECLMLVSDDSDFVGVLKEAKLRCLKTVVVGDADDGALKRVADAGFSWTEILKGKAKKEAVSVVGKWKDRDILKKLEWTYDPEVERKFYGSEDMFDEESEDLDFDGSDDGNSSDYMHKEDSGAWWELDTDSDADSSKSQ